MLTCFFHKALLDGTWEVIEIHRLPTNQYGMWVLVGDALHSLVLEVPRIFYINFDNPAPPELVIGHHPFSINCVEIIHQKLTHNSQFSIVKRKDRKTPSSWS